MKKPSPQQLAIFDWIENGKGSAIIEAVAGSGKTTTLIHGLAKTKTKVAFSAFNKAIVREIEERLIPLKVGSRVKVGTMHSFGLAAVKQKYPKTKIEQNKLRIIAEKVIEKFIYRNFAIAAASLAKQTGIGIESSTTSRGAWVRMIEHHSLFDSLPEYAEYDQAIEAAQEVLRVSNLNAAKLIDFDDMVYLPVLQDLPMRQYDWVFLDEAQDTNLVRRRLAQKMLTKGGRLVAVGDSHQAIYGFTGADCESMENICNDFDATRLPLTVSYRCPKNVVLKANEWVPHIQAAPDAEDGIVDSENLDNLISSKAFSPGDAIICRKTKPLIQLAFKLIKNGIPCKVEGRAIGKGLISLTKKWKVSTVGQLEKRIELWAAKEIEKAKNKGNYSRCEYVEDQAETLKTIMLHCPPTASIQVLTEKIQEFFGDSDGKQDILTLSTIHRAKGKEWDHVFALDMEVHSPSRWAQKPWEMQQEMNLCYVQVTRAKSHLTLVSS